MRRNKLINQLVIILILSCVSLKGFTQVFSFAVRSTDNRYAFTASETPSTIIPVMDYVTIIPVPMIHQWEKSTDAGSGFVNISGAVSASLSFAVPLTETVYYRRRTGTGSNTSYSNVIKYELVSANWEDRNFVRAYDVLVPGKTTMQQVIDAPIGEKFMSTTYMDGLERPIQQVSTGIATPDLPSGTWGDIVMHQQYDNFGKVIKNELPYSTSNSPGKFKESSVALQQAYYVSRFSDSKPYSELTYTNDPFGSMVNAKNVGMAWNASAGSTIVFDVNTAADQVPKLKIGILFADKPVLEAGTYYANNTLVKRIITDEYGKQVIEFYNSAGLLLLKKVQLADVPANNYDGWMCTLYVYDVFGNLRCEVMPEGVKDLYAQSWNFLSAPGVNALNEYSFLYVYDKRGRTIIKKTPGTEPLYMVYDLRHRLAATQDGNQRAKSPNEWTVHMYDAFDREVVRFIYYRNITLQDFATRYEDHGSSNQTVTRDGISVNAVLSPYWDEYISDTEHFLILKLNTYDTYQTAATLAYTAPLTGEFATVTNALPIAKTDRINGMATSAYTRILGTATFQKSSIYYDEEGNVIQALEENILGGIDITTMQYHWNGKQLAVNEKHGAPGKPFDNYKIHTTYSFDKIWRTKEVHRKFGAGAVKKMAAYEYNDMGQIKKKTLSPDYNGHFAGIGNAGGGLESQHYSYNIQGTVVGVNKDYALKAGAYNKWGHFFGYFLGYDKTETVFAGTRLNGQMSGQVWNTMGDDEQRKFDYTYDNAGRLLNADFKQKTGGSWSNSLLDYSTGGYTGKIEYDLNGNLKSMSQKGYIMGQTASVVIDDLRYVYASSDASNKLLKVTDQTTIGATLNGANRDFKDGSNTGDDYVYDANGNLIVDLNKGVRKTATGLPGIGVDYNYLDKPEKIYFGANRAGNRHITFTYDADGRKLKRSLSYSQVMTGTNVKEYWYVGNYVYESSTENTLGAVLKFINTAEGQLRIVTPVDNNNGYDAHVREGNIETPGGTQGVFDYFISDFRADTRMILTEEVQYSLATASMETAGGRGTVEEGIFGNAGAGNEVATTRVANVSGIGWASNTSGYVSRLNSSKPVGPNQLLKVMGGDLISATTKYYYENPVVNTGTTSTIINTVLGALAGTLVNSAGTGTVIKNNATAIVNNLNPGIFGTQWSDLGNTGSTKPKAYLNVMFFDERMHYVGEGSTSQRVQIAGDGAAPLALLNIKVPKNGYCMVFVSNESGEYVYFDDMIVRHDRGRILEENHYYAFGLKIATLSSRAFGAPNNAYGYQGEFNELDEDLGWHDFALRSYDPQIGRFLQADPYDQFASGYVGMGNDPVNGVDPSGGFVSPTGLLDVVITAGQSIGMSAMQIVSSINSVVSSILSTISIVTSVRTNQVGITQSDFKAEGFKTRFSTYNSNDINSNYNSDDVFKDDDGNFTADESLEGVYVSPESKTGWFKRNIGLIADVVQTGLDLIGSSEIPIISQAGDLLSAGVSLVRGDKAGAMMSLGAMVVPGLSQAKAAKSVARMLNRVKGIVKKAIGSGYNSFNAFKRTYGSAGKGNAWHHIVEQGGNNVNRFGAKTIHNTNNIIKLPHGAGSIHAKVSGYYSSKQPFTGGLTVREWLSTQSYQQQYDFGIKILKQFGWTP